MKTPPSRNRRARFRRAAGRGVFLLAALIVLDAWCVQGLFRPLQIRGTSMAPTLLGEHRELTCRDCGFRFACETAEPPPRRHAVCPNCGFSRNDPADGTECAGERILIDRTAFCFRPPRRWEVVAFRSPLDAERISVKRVVGLPGETVTIRNGNVNIDGILVRKNLEEQKSLLLPVYDARCPPPSGLPSRWTGQSPGSRWNCQEGRFTHPGAVPNGDDNSPIDWLVYRHWRRQAGAGDTVRVGPVDNVLSYNQNLPYREENVHAVADLFLAFRVAETAGRGTLWIRAGDGRDLLRASIGLQDKKIRTYLNNREIAVEDLPGEKLAGSEVEVSLIDRQFLLAVDGRIVGCQTIDSSGDPPPGTPEPFALGTQSLGVGLESLRIFRDVYYDPLPLELHGSPKSPTPLGADEFFVLGDNTAVSVDSRVWADQKALKRHLILGKPIIMSGLNPLP